MKSIITKCRREELHGTKNIGVYGGTIPHLSQLCMAGYCFFFYFVLFFVLRAAEFAFGYFSHDYGLELERILAGYFILCIFLDLWDRASHQWQAG
jgi:hypothetical protein